MQYTQCSQLKCIQVPRKEGTSYIHQVTKAYATAYYGRQFTWTYFTTIDKFSALLPNQTLNIIILNVTALLIL